MEAIRNLCPDAILLQDGQIKLTGATSQVIDMYLNSLYKLDSALSEINFMEKNSSAQFKRIKIYNGKGKATNRFSGRDTICFEVDYELKTNQYNLSVIILFHSMDGTHLFSVEDVEYNPELLLGRKAGSYKMKFSIPPNILNEGKFYFVGDMRPVLRNSIDMVDGFSIEVYSDKITPLAYSKRAYKGCIDLNIKAETMSFDSHKQV
jgi:hypothetical protein